MENPNRPFPSRSKPGFESEDSQNLEPANWVFFRASWDYIPLMIRAARFIFSSRFSKSSIFLAWSSFLQMDTNLASLSRDRLRICSRAWVEPEGFITTTSWHLGRSRPSSDTFVATTTWQYPSPIWDSNSLCLRIASSETKKRRKENLMETFTLITFYNPSPLHRRIKATRSDDLQTLQDKFAAVFLTIVIALNTTC